MSTRYKFFALLVSVLLLGGTARAQSSRLEFPRDSPSPKGNVQRGDILFGTTPHRNGSEGFSPHSLLPPRLSMQYANGILTLKDSQKTGATVWTGPLNQASFLLEKSALTYTLRDEQGNHILWTDASEAIRPDLWLEKEADGKAHLTGKDGKILWEGLLAATPPHSFSSKSDRQGTKYHIAMNGVLVDGTDGQFTFREASQPPFWSGRLTLPATILVREKPYYTLVSPRLSGSDSERVTHLRFSTERGKVTLGTQNNKALGVEPIEILKILFISPQQGELLLPFSKWSVQYRLPEVTLQKVGTVYLTYRDSKGRVFRRAIAYKSSEDSGYDYNESSD